MGQQAKTPDGEPMTLMGYPVVVSDQVPPFNVAILPEGYLILRSLGDAYKDAVVQVYEPAADAPTIVEGRG